MPVAQGDVLGAQIGVRSLASVLLCALCAMISGAHHPWAIGQRADAAPQHTLARLGCRISCAALGARITPSAVTIRRVLLALAPQTLTALTSPDIFDVVAVDGKTLHGSATATEAVVYLLAALTLDRHLAAQVRVPADTCFAPSLMEALMCAGIASRHSRWSRCPTSVNL